MLASIIIITKNQKKFLEKSFPLIFKQTFQNFEIIVVDSGSTDGALELMKRHKLKVVQIPSVEPQKFSYTQALQEGVKQAKGEVIARLSGDAVPADEYWLEAMMVDSKMKK